MVARKNPSFPAPPSPYDDDDLREFFLFSENTESLYLAHRQIAARLAKQGVAGQLTQAQVRAAWAPYVPRVIREYKREIGNTDYFTKATSKKALEWLVQWTEHELYGRGLAHMMKLAGGMAMGDE